MVAVAGMSLVADGGSMVPEHDRYREGTVMADPAVVTGTACTVDEMANSRLPGTALSYRSPLRLFFSASYNVFTADTSARRIRT